MAFEDADGNKRREFNDRNYASLWIRPLIFCACSLVAAGLLLGVSFMAPAKAWLAEVKLSAPVNGESAMGVSLDMSCGSSYWLAVRFASSSVGL